MRIPETEIIRAAEIQNKRQRYHEINRLAEAYNQKPETVRRYVDQKRRALKELLDAGVVVRRQRHHEQEPLFEQQWSIYEGFVGRDHDRSIPEPAPERDGTSRIVCVFADMHGYPLPQVIEAILDEAPDVTVDGGDVLDCFAFSRWPKDHHEPPQHEIARMTALYETLSAAVGKNYIIPGNHPARREKYFMARVEPWALGELRDPPLKMIAERYQNVELVETIHDYTTPTGLNIPAQFAQSFFVALGDLVVAHPEISRKHPGASARAFAEQFNAWCLSLGVMLPKVLAVGHCHRWSVTPGVMGQTLVELGYAGMPSALQYNMDAARLPPLPPEPGYLYVVQELIDDIWRCDLRTLRYVRV